MKNNFWTELKAPFFSLAPMEDVTDTTFREVVLNVSDSEVLKVLFTEFTSVDGLMDERGFERVSERLIVSESEKELLKTKKLKLVAQIWGNEPDKFMKSAELVTGMGLFDGIDINMGCPVKKVVKKETCSALIKNPPLAREIIKGTKAGTHLPVSVKTRTGFNTINTVEWMEQLLEEAPAAISLHGRIQKQMSEGEASWDEIAKAVELRNEMNSHVVMLGNGDVSSYQDGMDKQRQSGVEGLMVGRGVFSNPWIFNKNEPDITIVEKLNLLCFHINLFRKNWQGKKNDFILKRFFKIYVNNFAGAGALRGELMAVSKLEEALEIIENYHRALA